MKLRKRTVPALEDVRDGKKPPNNRTDTSFYDSFSCQSLVVEYIVHLLGVNAVLACVGVSKAWYELWTYNFVWIPLFRQRFFSLDLSRANDKMVPVLFPGVPGGRLVRALYQVQCLASPCQHAMSTLYDIRRPKYTRDFLYAANFVESARRPAVSPEWWSMRPKRFLDLTVQLQEDWDASFLPRLREPYAEMPANEFAEMPKWLADIVPTVAYRHVSVRGTATNAGVVTVTFECNGAPFALVINAAETPTNVRLALHTLRSCLCCTRKSQETSMTKCKFMWSRKVVRQLRIAGDPSDDALLLCVHRLLLFYHPFHRMTELAEDLPVCVRAESDRYWWARFIHSLMGTYSPYDEFELMPPRFSRFDTLEYWEELMELEESSDDDE